MRLLLSALLVTLAFTARADEAAKDLEKIQGNWIATQVTYNAKDHNKLKLRFVIKKDQIIVEGTDDVKKEYGKIGFKLDASTTPRCLDLTVEWCRNRETFGKPLISRQSVQNTLAEMARRVDVARVYTRSLVERQLAGETNLITEVCFAKNTAVEAGEWVANQAVQLFGGMGYMAESEVERQYRDMRILGIGGGTTEILTSLAAKTLGYQS
jgi:uncharacterized protein (TIGR03067 family)